MNDDIIDECVQKRRDKKEMYLECSIEKVDIT
jgi:hypothetical protein